MTTDPYRIWVSEIILQQTRVGQGFPYYLRFVERFPDVQALASAPEDEVMKYWQGLGYYSRARNLHEAARTIVKEYGGHFPATYEEVRRLKGVGDYTASAICSFAYGLPHAAVDGNAYRVLSRLFGVDTPIDTGAGKREFAALANELLDPHHAGDFNQAMMDFGATLCLPHSPDCSVCPLNGKCVALAEGRVEELPVKSHRTKVTERHLNYLYVRAGEALFLHKRGAGDIWQGLYELPLIESAEEWETEQLLRSPEFQQLMAGYNPQVRCVCRGVKHQLSHRLLIASCHEVVLPPDFPCPSGCIRLSLNELESYPVPKLVSVLLEKIGK